MRFVNSIFSILRFHRKNWKAIVLCFFAATVFWCFNALNKNYTTNISFPLAFDYDHENFIPVRPLPAAVRINVTGIGWNLFRRSAGVKVPPLVIPLEKPADVKKIVGAALPALFSNQLEEFQINFVITDTLHVAIEPKASRMMHVYLDSPGILFRSGYARTSEIVLAPDSIYVEGPERLINSLADPISLKIPNRNIDEDFHNEVEVQFVNDDLIKRDPPTVNVSFSVDMLMEVDDSVTLQVVNAPKRSWAFFGNRRIPVRMAIPQRALAKLNRDSLRAVVDLQSFTKGEKKILPRIAGLPPYSRVLSIDSVSIKF